MNHQQGGPMRITRGPPPQHGWSGPPSQFPPRQPAARNYNNEMGAAYGSYTVSYKPP